MGLIHTYVRHQLTTINTVDIVIQPRNMGQCIHYVVAKFGQLLSEHPWFHHAKLRFGAVNTLAGASPKAVFTLKSFANMKPIQDTFKSAALRFYDG